MHPSQDVIALGGDLSVSTILEAYRKGIFPWFVPGEEIVWWCPYQRFVLFPDSLYISKSMNKILQRGIFEFSINTAFREVVFACSSVKGRDAETTWLTPELQESLSTLHEMQKAISIEVWQNNELVGGLYGILQGRVFCGESMFARVSNASKAGFIWFIQNYGENLKLIDCQLHSSHLESLGGEYIPRNLFLETLGTPNV